MIKKFILTFWLISFFVFFSTAAFCMRYDPTNFPNIGDLWINPVLTRPCLTKRFWRKQSGDHLISYSETGLTIMKLKYSRARGDHFETKMELTNVWNFPIQLLRGKIKYSNDNSEIFALQDYKNACYFWHFPELRDATSAKERKEEYDSLFGKLVRRLKARNSFYEGRAISIYDLYLDQDNHIVGLQFGFPENFSLRGNITQKEFDISWITTPLDLSVDEYEFHEPLQRHNANISGRVIPYYYVAPSSHAMPTEKTIVMLSGGPKLQYIGEYSSIIKMFSDAGWATILPQESLRTGFGWKHFSNGIGEIGRKNMHQLLHVFHDAIDKGLITNTSQIYFYGRSYGGFVGTLFSVKWDDLHKEAGLAKRFNFQLIMAEASLVDLSPLKPVSLYLPFIGDTDLEKFRKIFMPLHNIKSGESLSAPLTMIHGYSDKKCPASEIQEFSQKLLFAGYQHSLLWHNGGHGIRHSAYSNFLLIQAQGRKTDNLERQIGLIKTF